MSSTERFLNGLRRLHAADDALAWTNDAGDLKFSMTSVADDADGRDMEFEVAYVVDPADAKLRRLLDKEPKGMLDDDDDPTAFLIDSFDLDRDDPAPDVLAEMQALFRKTKAYAVCPCDEYVVKDGGAMCVHCEMTATDEGLVREECPICMETGAVMHMTTTGCCKKRLHVACWDACVTKGKSTACPFCRDDPLVKLMPQINDIIATLAANVAARNATEVVDAMMHNATA